MFSRELSKKKVTIVQRRLPHYRVSRFKMLRFELGRFGIDLQLLVGSGTDEEESKKDGACLTWSINIPTKYYFGNLY